MISIVPGINDGNLPLKDINTTSKSEFVFVPVKVPPSATSKETDTYVPGKTPVPSIGPKRRARTNKHYSSQSPQPVVSFCPSIPAVVNDVELFPPIVIPLTDGRNKLSDNQVGTAEVDVFTQAIYFDALSTINNDFDIYNDGLDIVTFGQQSFSTQDPTTTYVAPP